MKPPVKTLAFITIFFFSIIISNAQLRLSSANGITADVQKVIDDYPNHFQNILGELIIQNPQSTDYQCNFKVTGAEECTITTYTGKKKIISSWQAVMLTTENFNEAKRKFRSLYNQLNNLSSQSMYLKGAFEAPAEEKKFTSVLFSFDPAAESVKNLRIELVMEAEVMIWKVKLLVYDRTRDDDEQGEVKEN
jgi:hypothetical protein